VQRQTDCLDYVIDNPVTGMREIYRDGVLKVQCARGMNHPWLAAYGAEGEWGFFPAHAPAEKQAVA
jgi:hypothetical protein